MKWNVIGRIGAEDPEAVILNRQISDLDRFRADALSPRPPSNKFFRANDAVNEALRREYLLRRDIVSYLRRRQSPRLASEESAVKALDALLTERNGHRK
ncbi:MAG TPA: hypothetical protein VH253_06340 [Phycisphaerae bacterium]|nr:hypothetical protein [Phycisphaerae bacterium]